MSTPIRTILTGSACAALVAALVAAPTSASNGTVGGDAGGRWPFAVVVPGAAPESWDPLTDTKWAFSGREVVMT